MTKMSESDKKELAYLERCRRVAKALGVTLAGSTCNQGFSFVKHGLPYGEHVSHMIVLGVEKLLEEKGSVPETPPEKTLTVAPKLGPTNLAPWPGEIIGAVKMGGDDFLWAVLVESKHEKEEQRKFVVWTYNGSTQSFGSGEYFPFSQDETSTRARRYALMDAMMAFEKRYGKTI